MTTRRVLLLRHGRTAWNAEHRFQGHADPPLDATGRAQAAAVAPVLAAMRPQLIVCSSAARAQRTAQDLATATGLAVQVDARLRERGLGRWEGLTRDDVARRFPDEYADWIAGRDVSRRGGETREQVAQRVVEVVEHLPEVTLAVLVMHGASATALTNALVGIEQDRRPLVSLSNCHWTELVGRDEAGVQGERAREWRVHAHNVGVPDPAANTDDALHEDDDEAADARA